MFGFNIFETDDLLDHVRKFQKSNDIESSPETLMPDVKEELNWNHYNLLEKIICDHTSLDYLEQEDMEIVED